MIKIHQAIWGYSSGHHLLASSGSLSNQSIKMLEPLTDLSGSEMVSAFDGYLTGCPLQSDNYYALSKTWYAQEMSRPGCVWTHTLLLEYSSITDLRTIDFESLFQRPNSNEVGWKDRYSKPIYVLPQSKNEIISDSDVCESALNMFLLMTYHLEPIIIAATNVKFFNKALELLIVEAGLDFFSDISFCTGSFSNRALNRVQLDLQIVPANLSKLVSRTNQKGVMYTDIPKNIGNPHNDTAGNTITQEEFYDIKKFILFCNSQYYRRCYWAMFEEIYKTIINLEDFYVSKTVNILQNQLNDEDVSTVMKKTFETIFLPIKSKDERNPNALIKVLFDFLTIDQSMSVENYIVDETLINVLNWIWTQYHQQMLESLPQLMDHNLNRAGEDTVKYIATLIELNDYSLLLLQNANMCSLMLRFNWKLALCEDVWKQPKNIQVEALRELRKFSDELKKENNACRDIIYLIFKTSSYDLSDEMYKTFEDSSIEALFYWYDTRNVNNSTLKLWYMLCKKNQVLSINKLEYVQSSALFEAVISVLDPYDNNIKSTSPEIWERLYKRFCRDNSAYSVRSEFAQFVLPITLRSNYFFSKELLKFIFITVHKVLANDSMEYRRWERLSVLLPEVAWYNSWDKCKRLRKAAKLRKYDIDFGDSTSINKN
ncbi:hypothetical protein [Ruminiclostridium cellobioparum]|uniref:Uncharacterized protein n=1 Tax=Ruminiclostridium cellobioparum subsp. termitidis CT1112 TaxID=1195236 RepID=S0FKE9_RUMCE|nr:hypothetical protein [Ruminiclostridium cellobioparum]EMS72690.1 hypothetical protein CTER_1508 [Ruminiclostridium cellobioparum subsp. termitidis CT1112]